MTTKDHVGGDVLTVVKVHPWQGITHCWRKFVNVRKGRDAKYWYFHNISCRELLLNNNLLRVLPYELGRLFQLQTLGLKGESSILLLPLIWTKNINVYFKLNSDCLKLPLSIKYKWNLSATSLYKLIVKVNYPALPVIWCLNLLYDCFSGNPLSQDILNLYQEPDGTRKLLNYMLDNLAGKWLGRFTLPRDRLLELMHS